MHHLPNNIHQDITRILRKDKYSMVNKTEYQSKEIQQVNPGEHNKQPEHQVPTISTIDKSLSRNRQRV